MYQQSPTSRRGNEAAAHTVTAGLASRACLMSRHFSFLLAQGPQKILSHFVRYLWDWLHSLFTNLLNYAVSAGFCWAPLTQAEHGCRPGSRPGRQQPHACAASLPDGPHPLLLQLQQSLLRSNSQQWPGLGIALLLEEAKCRSAWLI